MSIWDDPDLKTGGDFFKFEKVSDTISGRIQNIGTHKFEDGKVVAQILIATDGGEEITVSAGQTKLKIALQEERPEIGDWISIGLSQIEKRAGGKTLKHFDVEVRRANGKPAATAAPDPLAGLNETQRAAIAAAQSTEAPF